MLVVPLTAASPTTLTLRFLSPLFGPDLTLVTAVTTGLLRRDLSTTTLTWAIISATSRELVAQYTFSGGELTTSGAYYLAPQLAYQGGAVVSETIPLFVGSAYNSIPQLEQDAWLLATVPVPGGAIANRWTKITTSGTASPLLPLMRADLRSGPLTVTLWPALNGDIAELVDVYNACNGTNSLTVTAATGQQVPIGNGTYASSTTRTTAGVLLRWKFDSTDNLWLPW